MPKLNNIQTSMVGFDLETTGVKIKESRPVQIGAVYYDTVQSNTRIILNMLCNPMLEIDPGASAVHGITGEHIKNMPDYMIASWVFRSLLDNLDPEYLVTFNGSMFDIPLINNLFPAVPSTIKHVDVLDMAYRYFPTCESFKLGNLYNQFLGRPLSGAHDAIIDIVGMLELVDVFVGLIGKPIDVLYAELLVPTPYKVLPISKKYKGWPLDKVPRSFADWLKNTADGPLRPDLKATVDYILGN